MQFQQFHKVVIILNSFEMDIVMMRKTKYNVDLMVVTVAIQILT